MCINVVLLVFLLDAFLKFALPYWWWKCSPTSAEIQKVNGTKTSI